MSVEVEMVPNEHRRPTAVTYGRRKITTAAGGSDPVPQLSTSQQSPVEPHDNMIITQGDDDENESYQFGWKKHLMEMGQSDSGSDSDKPNNRPEGVPSFDKGKDFGEQNSPSQSQSYPSTQASQSSSLPTLTSSDASEYPLATARINPLRVEDSSEQEEVRLKRLPLLSRSSNRRQVRDSEESDSEDEAVKAPSPIRSRTSSSRNVSHSPTSSLDPAQGTTSPMRRSSLKRQPAKSTLGTQPALMFEDEQPTKTQSNSRRSRKAPTKRQLEESGKESARMLADQHVSLTRKEQPRKSLTSLFETIQKSITPGPSSIKAKASLLMSDPIISSSPNSNDGHRYTAETRLEDSVHDNTDISSVSSEPNLHSSLMFGKSDILGFTHEADDTSDHRTPQAPKDKLAELRKLKLELSAKARQRPPIFPDSVDDDDFLEIVRPTPDKGKGKSGTMTKGTQAAVANLSPSRRRAVLSRKRTPGKSSDFDSLPSPSQLLRRNVRDTVRPEPELTPAGLNRLLLSKSEETSRKIRQEKEEDWLKRGGQTKAAKASTYDGQWLNEASASVAVNDYPEHHESGSDGDDEDEDYVPEEKEADPIGVSPCMSEDGNSDEEDKENRSQEVQQSQSQGSRRPSGARDVLSELDVELSDGDEGINRSTTSRTHNDSDTEPLQQRTSRKRTNRVVSDDSDDEPDSPSRQIGTVRFRSQREGKLGAPPSLRPGSSTSVLQDSLFLSKLFVPPGVDEELDAATPLVSSIDTPSQRRTQGPLREISLDLSSQFSSPTKPASSSQGGADLEIGEGMTQLFVDDADGSQEAKNPFAKLRGSSSDAVDLSQSPSGVLPSMRMTPRRQQETDDLFRIQEEAFLIREPAVEPPKQQLYLNDDGFFTQTNPSQSGSMSRELSSTTTYSLDGGPQLSTQELDLDDFQSSQLIKGSRLPHKYSGLVASRSSSPETQAPATLDAFVMLKDGATRLRNPKKDRVREKLGTSVFVEQEAQLSDDEYGFTSNKNAEDEKEESEDEDAHVEGLVDDTQMNDETLAADLVIEKHKEHAAEDDAAIEKLHQQAVAGKLRGKRRDRALGDLDDSDSDDDYRPRVLAKKRKLAGFDQLEDLAKDPTTLPFYAQYRKLLDDDDETQPAPQYSDEEMKVDEDLNAEPQETIDPLELKRQLQAAAKEEAALDTTINPDDVSWVNRDDDDDDLLEIDNNPMPPPQTLRRGPIEDDHELLLGAFPSSRAANQRNRNVERERQWAKEESQNGTYASTRAARGTAVTGHSNRSVGSRSASSSSLRQSGSSTASKLGKPRNSVINTFGKRRGFEE